ncbi:MAG: carboxypeptidase-like regulatory domain-containing protein [Acidobacteriia bacterium]|nr:carboxypeptidase-like regulatory domain-containing protein [Terriglobia bacterium]
MRIRLLGILVIGFCLLPMMAQAQVESSGSIGGAVSDSSGAVVVAAKVTITNVATHFDWTTTTSSTGQYQIGFLPAGTYEVAAEAPSFKRLVRKGITLSAAVKITVDLALEVGQVTEQVTVVGDAPTVDTNTADIGNTVSGTQLRNLPLSTRQFIQMLTLEPGVNSNLPDQPGFGSLSGAGLSVNGLRQNQNNYMIDGVNNIDVYNSNNMLTPNLDALAEFRVSRTSYDAEAGRSAGATVNLITRSGTSEYHGSAFEYFRNDKLNARNYFASSKPENRWNNFGYTFGGPILKNKLFFFWSEEFRRAIQSAGTSIARVPTAQERAGIFPGIALSTTLQKPDASGPCVTVTGPAGNPTSTIDPSCFDQNGFKLINTYFPLPTPGFSMPGYNYNASDPDFTRTREEIIRFDYKPTQKLAIFARYAQDIVNIHSPFGLWHENPFPGTGASDEFEPLQNAGLNVTYAARTNLVNEFQYSYDHNLIRIFETDASSRNRAPGGLTIPYHYPSNALNNSNNRIPNLSFGTGGWAGINLLWPFRNTYFYSKITDNLTWTHGKHAVKTGVLLTRQGKDENNCCPDNQNGNFIFGGWNSPTGDAMADLLVGVPFEYQESASKPKQVLRYWDFELYAQDTIKVRPNFTLNVGLRYSLFTPEHEQNGMMANFDPKLFDPTQAPGVLFWGPLVDPAQPWVTLTNYNYMNGLVYPANANIPAAFKPFAHTSPYGDALYEVGKKNFAPRIGFSWDVFGTHKTAVRGGYGLYYDRWAPYMLWMKNAAPFNYSVNIYQVRLSNPTGWELQYPMSINAIDPHFKVPYSQQWSLGIQQEILPDTLLEVSYVGTKGTHLIRMRNQNQPQPSLAIMNWWISPDSVRPYAGYSFIQTFEPSGSSSYHSLQVMANHRFTKGLALQISYTWSKTIAVGDNDTAWPQDSKNMANERGLASYDRPHVLTLSYVWEIPFAKHMHNWGGKILDGWTWSGITSMYKGNAYSILSGKDMAGIGSWAQRADQIGDPNAGTKTVSHYFNTAAFTLPAPLTFGNSAVGVVRGPGTNNWNMAIGKTFKLNERFDLQFRGEFFNTWNHHSFTGLNNNISNGASFGSITGAMDPRIIQLGLRLGF